MKKRYGTQAAVDMDDAVDFYRLKNEDLAAEFMDSVANAIDEAAKHPGRFPVYEAAVLEVEYRRVSVDRFPYYVVYQFGSDEIFIAAVSHASREPGYWAK